MGERAKTNANQTSESAGATRTKTGDASARNAFDTAKSEQEQYENPHEYILHLQRTIGNRAVGRLIESGFFQGKLKIGPANDKYEQEADSVADKVVSMPGGEPVKSSSDEPSRLSRSLADSITPLRRSSEKQEEELQEKEEPEEETSKQRLRKSSDAEDEEKDKVQGKFLQRTCAKCEKEYETAQRQRRPVIGGNLCPSCRTESLFRKPNEKTEKAASPDIESSIFSAKGGGRSLSANERSFYEPRLAVAIESGSGRSQGLSNFSNENSKKADFSSVKIHTGGQANHLARSVNARAFTVGNDIFFGSGQYSSDTTDGKKLMAHELTHTVQQGGGVRRKTGQIEESDTNLKRDNFNDEKKKSEQQNRQMEIGITSDTQDPSRVESQEQSKGQKTRTNLTQNSHKQQNQNTKTTSMYPTDTNASSLNQINDLSANASKSQSNQVSLPVSNLENKADIKQTGNQNQVALNNTNSNPKSSEADIASDSPADIASVEKEELTLKASATESEPSIETTLEDGVFEIAHAPDLESDQLNLLIDQIQEAAAIEKRNFLQIAKQRRNSIQKSINRSVLEIENDGSIKVEQLARQIEIQRNLVRTQYADARTKLRQLVAEQKLAAIDDREEAINSLPEMVDQVRQKALMDSSEQAGLLENFGQAEARRTRRQVIETIRRLNVARSNAAANVQSDDEKVNREVRIALRRVVGENIRDTRDKGEETATAAVEASHEAASSIRSSGRDLAGNVQNTAQLEQGIRETGQAVVEQIAGMEQATLTQLAHSENLIIANLDRAQNTLSEKIEQVTQAATKKLKASGFRLLRKLSTAESSVIAGIENMAEEAISRVAGEDTGGELPPEQLDALKSEIFAGFKQTRLDAQLGYVSQANRYNAFLLGAPQRFNNELGKVISEIENTITETAKELKTIVNIPEDVQGQAQGIRTQAQEAYQQAKQRWTQEASRPIEQAKQEWQSARGEAENKIREKVDEFVSKTNEMATQAPAQYLNTAKEAEKKATASWLSRAWSGIVEGLSRFWDGLKYFLLAFLIVFVAIVAILAFIVGDVVLLFLGAIAAIALLIVGIGFLVYGLVTALIHRFGQAWEVLGDRPWWEKLLIVSFCSPYFIAVALGDLVGLTPVLEGAFGHDAITFEELDEEERWARATVGVLTILTLILLWRVGRGGRGPGRGRSGRGRGRVRESAERTGEAGEHARETGERARETGERAGEAGERTGEAGEITGEPASRVMSSLGEKAIIQIKKAFGSIKEFNSHVESIRNITRPTAEMIHSIRTYFERMGYDQFPENRVMLERLQEISRGERIPEKVDIDFLQHEMLEKSLVERGIEKGYQEVPGESQVWDPAHDITRKALGVDDVYHPDALSQAED